MNSFFSEDELKDLGLKAYGENVLISRNAMIYNPEKLVIGSNVRIDDFAILTGDIVIHDYVHLAARTSFFGAYGIEIDDFCGVSSDTIIYSASDDYSGESLTNPLIPNKYKPKYISGKVHLKKHSIVGCKSVIMPNVTIGEGTAVGAMSFVSKSLDSWGIYVGVPAKRKSERSKDLLELEKDFIENNI